MKIVVTRPCPTGKDVCRGTIDVPVNDGIDVGSTRATMQEAAMRVLKMGGSWGCNRCSYRGGLTSDFLRDVDKELDRLNILA